jgi:dolichol-phosphate mannosyltransferase
MRDSNSIHLSIVSPVYKAEKIVDELVRRIVASVELITTDYEIILVEDGSPDDSWSPIQKNAQLNPKVKGLKLSRNFGQHHAITAGLDYAQGEWVVVMDCDLQDLPEEISKLYNKAKEGYDVVFARRAVRQDSFLKKLSSTLFSKFYAWLSGTKPDNSIANFGIYNHKVIQAVCKLREPMRSFPPMVTWVGFKQTAVDVVHASRFEGSSSYNFSKLVRLATDIALAYSDKPLRLTVRLGMLISIVSVVVAIVYGVQYFNGTIKQPGFASIVLSLWFLGGVIIFSLGVVGLYISKIFEGIKNRPLYIVDQKTKND